MPGGRMTGFLHTLTVTGIPPDDTEDPGSRQQPGQPAFDEVEGADSGLLDQREE